MDILRAFFFLCLLGFSSHVQVHGSPNKVALVAGGAGFLGSHLCERLLKENYHVICVDNLCTGSQSNIEHLKKHPHFSFVFENICNPLEFKVPIDEIYNLACPASPPKYQIDPIDTLKTNFLGTLNLLELAKTKNAIILQASTSEVYGDPKVHPQTEEYWGNVNPIGIRACYDEGKRVAETLIFEYHRQYGLAVKVARIFNTYGPRLASDDGRVISNFIIQALGATPITVYGNGSQTRSFCYVDDLIEGFRCLMQSPFDCTGPINLGNPKEFTMNELATLITKQIRSNSSINFHPLPKDDPTKRKPDTTKAKKLLGWEPKISLEEGLLKTIAYFEEKKDELESAQ